MSLLRPGVIKQHTIHESVRSYVCVAFLFFLPPPFPNVVYLLFSSPKHPTFSPPVSPSQNKLSHPDTSSWFRPTTEEFDKYDMHVITLLWHMDWVSWTIEVKFTIKKCTKNQQSIFLIVW